MELVTLLLVVNRIVGRLLEGLFGCVIAWNVSGRRLEKLRLCFQLFI